MCTAAQTSIRRARCMNGKCQGEGRTESGRVSCLHAKLARRSQFANEMIQAIHETSFRYAGAAPADPAAGWRVRWRTRQLPPTDCLARACLELLNRNAS